MYTSAPPPVAFKSVVTAAVGDEEDRCPLDDDDADNVNDDDDDDDPTADRIEFPGGIKVPISLHTNLQSSSLMLNNKVDEGLENELLTNDDIDAITSSSSFASSPCTTGPSKFVIHAVGCKCEFDNGSCDEVQDAVKQVASGEEVFVPRCFGACRSLISADPSRPLIESDIMKSSSSCSPTGICSLSSSWLRNNVEFDLDGIHIDDDDDDDEGIEEDNAESNTIANDETSSSSNDLPNASTNSGARAADDDSNASTRSGDSDDDNNSPKTWMKNLMNEAYKDTSTPHWETAIFKRRQRQKLQAYQQLYIEYENIFKNTHKRHHADILAGLYKFQVQKALRTLFIIPRASPKKMKKAKLLWLQYSSLSKRNVNNDFDISEAKNFPMFIDAYPIKHMSKSLICHRNKSMSPMTIETRITLFNGSTRVFYREFDPKWWWNNDHQDLTTKKNLKQCKKPDDKSNCGADNNNQPNATTTITSSSKKLKFSEDNNVNNVVNNVNNVVNNVNNVV